MSIKKKVRFEVFKRDGFICGYCGNTPPKIILEVDHIIPVSEGGNDDMNNLITSCFNCNRGKTNIKLNKISPQIQDNLEVLQEKEAQLKEYYKFIKKIEIRLENDINEISLHYERHTNNKYTFSDSFKVSTIKNLLKNLNKYEIKDAISIACEKFNGGTEDGREIKYFCGICWNWIKRPETKNNFYGKS